jgi:hypothetical protein
MIGWQIRLDSIKIAPVSKTASWGDSGLGSFSTVGEAIAAAEKDHAAYRYRSRDARFHYRVHVFIRVEWVTPKSRDEDDFEGCDCGGV